MSRGIGLYRVLPFVALAALALSSCRGVDYEQRDPWRAEAEEKCLAGKTVQASAYMEPESSITRGACGMTHPFKVAAMDGGMVEVSPKATLACPIISEVDRWIADSVQRSATTWFGEQVVEIKQISAYSCRGMNGQPGAHISEHAFGNALDVASFKLQSGREIVIKKAWKFGSYEERGFLRDIISDACERFTTVLGPGSNSFHYDHFHFDLSRRSSGRTYCNPEVARMTPPNRAYARAPGSRGPQVAQLPAQTRQQTREPMQGPSVVTRENYPQRGYNDLPLGNRPPEYDPPMQAARAPYPQQYPQGGQPVDLHPQPSYAQNPPMQAAPSYTPPQQSYPSYAAPNPNRPLPPRNIGAKLGSKEEIMTGSIDKKHSAHEKPLGKKPAAHTKAAHKTSPKVAAKPVAQPAPKPSPKAAPMTSGDLFSPVPMAAQHAAPRKPPIEEATMRALKAN
jgi:hypothetical protein